MSVIGTAVIALIMLCAAIGAAASIRNTDWAGRSWKGLHSIGHIFVPVVGIMAAIPLLSQLADSFLGPVLHYVGAAPAVAATSLIAVDMGGYQLVYRLADSRESWIMAMIVGYMAGAAIVFSISVPPWSCVESRIDDRSSNRSELLVRSGDVRTACRWTHESELPRPRR